MHRWLAAVLFILILLGLPSSTQAVSLTQLVPSPPEYAFGSQVTFRAELSTEKPITAIQVFLRSEGESESLVGEASYQNGQILYVHNLAEQPLRAFSIIEYWYRIEPQDSEPYTSEVFTFYYEDNRYTWQTLSDGPFTVHWYEGDIAFAQMVINAAQVGLERAQSLLQLPPIEETDIYVYASGVEMQSTLRLGGLHWVAGQADPDLGVMVVSLPPGPGQRSETERQVPHELMHILTFQIVGDKYYDLPRWLREGLASANEKVPNPDYYTILMQAYANDTLIPFTSLCQGFPEDSTVYLAYAEADSFTRYLHQTYGSAGLLALLEANAEGLGCQGSLEAALGDPLTNLEQGWRRTVFGEIAILSALANLLPWITLLFVILAVPTLLTLTSLLKPKTSQPNLVPRNR